MRIIAHSGRHARQQAPTRWSYLIVALAALAALIAAAAFAAQSGQSAQAQVTAPRVPVLDRAAENTAVMSAASLDQDKAAILRAAVAAVARARAAYLAAHTYTVRGGDSLSAVAARHCGQARDWTGIYAASRARHWTAGNANSLTAGQHLWLSCAYLPSMLKYAPAPPPPPRAATTLVSSTSLTRHYVYHYRHYRRSATSTTYSGSTSMQRCIIARESGGNSQVMNSSGHYGLYQFSASTWAASGGNPADFGHASVAEQNQAFYNAVAKRGYSDWSPYDGC